MRHIYRLMSGIRGQGVFVIIRMRETLGPLENDGSRSNCRPNRMFSLLPWAFVAGGWADEASPGGLLSQKDVSGVDFGILPLSSGFCSISAEVRPRLLPSVDECSGGIPGTRVAQNTLAQH